MARAKLVLQLFSATSLAKILSSLWFISNYSLLDNCTFSFLDKNIVIYNHLFLLRAHGSKAGELIPLKEVLKESGPMLIMTLALINIYLLLL